MSTTLRADLVSSIRDTKYSFKATWRFGDFAGFEKRPQTLHKNDEERFTNSFSTAAKAGTRSGRGGARSITIMQFTDDVLPSVGLGKVNRELLDQVLSSLQPEKGTHELTESKHGEESKHSGDSVEQQQQPLSDENDIATETTTQIGEGTQATGGEGNGSESGLGATESKEDILGESNTQPNNNTESKDSLGDGQNERVTSSTKQVDEDYEVGISLEDFARLIESVYTPAYIFGHVLSRACARGDEQVIQDLLERGCDPNEPDGRGMTCFHYAAEHGSSNSIACLAQHCPITLQLDTPDQNGWTAVLFAAARGHVSTIETLHKMGASLALASVESRTAMHWASLNAHIPVLAWLLQSQRQTDAETNARDRSGWTALHCAVVNGDIETIRVLMQGGVDYRIKDKLSRSARQYCDEEMRPLYDAQLKKLKSNIAR